MSSVPFTRQLGARSGVQLNPIIDNSERAVGGNADQVIALVGRFERGRIDKAFRVNMNTLYRLLGQPSSIKVSALNEAFVHLYEALRAGAYEAVVYRLNVEDAEILLASCVADTVAANVWPAPSATAAVGNIFTVKHLECFNEGLTFEVNAPEKLDDTLAQVATKEIKLRLKDLEGNLLFEFEGSLDPAAKNEFGQSRYLPEVVTAATDLVEVTVAANASVPTTAAFYGKNVDGSDKFVSKNLICFTESGTGYTSGDYDRAMAALKYGDHSFGYIIGGGTQSVSLLNKLFALGFDLNKQVLWDVPGSYTPSQAITFYNQLSIDSHYSQCYWSPLLHDDPLNGGKAYIGKSAQNAGFRCLRNAATDANGIPRKNYPVAGKNYPVTSTGIVQKYTPTEQELDDLAKARINPVIFVRYNTGGRYVFFDSLTGAKTEADRKLIAVADMSSQVDDWVTQYAQECLQLPMREAVKRMTDFLQKLFEALEAAQWIVPTPYLDNRAFVGEVKPNAQRPTDRLDVNYWLSYDGTARAIYVQQTIAKK